MEIAVSSLRVLNFIEEKKIRFRKRGDSPQNLY